MNYNEWQLQNENGTVDEYIPTCRSNNWRIDLNEAALTGADLRDVDLTGADLTRAGLRGADLTGANLTGANLYGANMYGANLYRADLTGADLRGADLTGANLYGTTLSVATINWQSHDLIAEILERAADDNVPCRMLAGLILASRDWCWDRFLSLDIDPSVREWALDELRGWVQHGDDAPDVLRI